MPPEKTGRILVLDETHPVFFEQISEDWEVSYLPDASRERVLEILPEFHGLIVRSRIRIDAALLERAERLIFIGRLGVGVEHIDRKACEEKDIELITTPEGSRDTVAEHTLGLVLGLMNNLFRADRQVRSGRWLRKTNTGTELKGKTIGLLGYGNMGQAVARRLSGFSVRVITYDRYRSQYGDAYAEEVDLETLQAESQVLSIHIPYQKENHYFINGAFLDRFRHPIFLINTSRGTVLHTQDLVERLRSGRVQGAALDVLEYEEMSFTQLDLSRLPEPFQYLSSSDRVILTPHIAGWSHESAEGHARVLADKIEARYSGKPFARISKVI
jgi:D-3-phosphoglycerate dehydrogenase